MATDTERVGNVAVGEGWQSHNVPFRHWVCDLAPRLIGITSVGCEVAHHLRANPSAWIRYENDVERHKLACDAVGKIGPRTADVFHQLTEAAFVAELAALTGVADLQPDPTFHGAGVHIVEPGGYLGAHLDYNLHPKLSGMERRVNLILFVAGGKGGEFELYDDEGREVVTRVPAIAGNAVVWCPGDVEFHGTGKNTGLSPRLSLAVYYVAPARPTATRKRALFVPHREPL